MLFNDQFYLFWLSFSDSGVYRPKNPFETPLDTLEVKRQVWLGLLNIERKSKDGEHLMSRMLDLTAETFPENELPMDNERYVSSPQYQRSDT